MSRKDRKSTESGLPWHIVEEAINRESQWLKRVIEQASILAEKGANPAALQILLGHESLDTTTAMSTPSLSMLKTLTANIIPWLSRTRIKQL